MADYWILLFMVGGIAVFMQRAIYATGDSKQWWSKGRAAGFFFLVLALLLGVILQLIRIAHNLFEKW